ncbi:hypothetical protein BC936DRAFT_148902 [Jimgerdemannia flammicorona]|uniref:Uncharacterized protein n=2 Tax=Jimgerdemannia flammicorona TaxID=994334 RepID=A0A433QTG9_9FUNG|nr:hypothetical protein BC936DRAFT_148902 [Jimgerdemannia flammicorona]RUS33083.1 hypothetical protein BC938DRAFT_473164 [Jimgerdemannia flammicorona]
MVPRAPSFLHPFNDDYLPSEIIAQIVECLPGHLLFELKDTCVALSEPCRNRLFKHAYKLGFAPSCTPKYFFLREFDNDPLGWRRDDPWGRHSYSGLDACKHRGKDVYQHMGLNVQDLFHIAGSRGDEREVSAMWDVISVLHLDKEALFSQVVKDFHDVLDVGDGPSQIAMLNAYSESECYDCNVRMQMNRDFQTYVNCLYNRYQVGDRPQLNERVEACLIGDDAIFRGIARYRAMLAKFWTLKHQLFPFNDDENRAWLDRRRDMVEDLKKHEAMSVKPFVNEHQRRMWCANWKAERDRLDNPVKAKSWAEWKEERKREKRKVENVEQF